MEIAVFRPEHQSDYARLNRAWIERHFTIETHDLEQLGDPEKFVLTPGGQIFVALADNGSVIGTVAMAMTEPGVYELAKMCVDDAFQGRGIGRKLGEAAILWARGQNARLIWLESNRRLAPAIALYHALGFVETPLMPSPYARADIRMEIVL